MVTLIQDIVKFTSKSNAESCQVFTLKLEVNVIVYRTLESEVKIKVLF